ncbi:MAG: hypothetical protein BGO14_06990 [Chlamydiales bacterium 38-26]|nr:hypothetical protein [Chlamydiales bacterium]OJV08619.1 MAG: hypothetical protein BGO14_06990 [Chlamydiales bacterium 38-26]
MSYPILRGTPLASQPHETYSCTEEKKCLTRQEAKSKLQTLIPGQEEHHKLQDALLRTNGIAHIHLSNHTSYKVYTSPNQNELLGGFGTSEHVAIGEEVKLQGLPQDTPLMVKGAVQIQFAHIIALAGDFYGVPGQAISLPGGDDDQKTKRFENSFNTLVKADNNEVRKLLIEIKDECSQVKHSSLPHHCYSSQMIEGNDAKNKIKKDLKALLYDNSDHFSNNARDAYRIGHTYALKMAKEAGLKQDLEGLKLAYALDAFACHFLTDLFAAGHIRNQRGELELFLISELKFPADKAKPLAGILTGAQHEKDGNEGLNVMNENGDQWRAYGDGCFFTPKCKDNREKVIAATQQSVDEIYQAYLHPQEPTEEFVYQLLPRATELNPLPIYTVENDAKALYLNVRGKKIAIKTQVDYLTKGISQALRYLPQNYIDGFTKIIKIEIPPVISKFIAPQLERFTGSLWNAIGMASQYHMRKELHKMSETIHEMADGVKASYENTLKILKLMEEFDEKLDHHTWLHIFQELRSPISTIRSTIFEYQNCEISMNEEEIKNSQQAIWKAAMQIATIFAEGTSDHLPILASYKTFLESKKTMTASEITLKVTLWFRQMLDYQAQAFKLSILLRMSHDSNQMNLTIATLMKNIEDIMLKQIEANQAFIDTSLIDKSEKYLALQLSKFKIKQLAFK